VKGTRPASGSGVRERAVAGERNRLRRVTKLLGPGLIAGASDDDPATIGTCASVGASLGYVTLWTMLATFPMISAAQYVSAKIGQVAGAGLTTVMCKHYSRVLLYPVLFGLLVANSINAGADLGAMAAATNLLIPVPAQALIIPIATLVVTLQVWGNYYVIERTFKWLTLALLAYIGAAILAKPDIREVVSGTFVPRISFDYNFLESMVAISGTTFPPYLYFWQSNQEVEQKVSFGIRHPRFTPPSRPPSSWIAHRQPLTERPRLFQKQGPFSTHLISAVRLLRPQAD
jgi:NRAMP (natural resistance-associated macrophage protein)-like metal ion transporter